MDAVVECGGLEDGVAKRWTAKSRLEREEIILAALASSHGETSALAREHDGNNREIAPEITLGHLAGNGGEGFVKLVKDLLPDPTSSSPYFIVRNTDFERIYGFQLNTDSLLPRSKIIRAFQEEHLIIRHTYMLILCLRMLGSLVRISTRYRRQGR